MKPLMLFLLAAVLASGCCKEYCNQEPALYVSFDGLKPTDTDSVYVFTYEPGTQVQTDSSFRHFPSTNENGTSFVNFPLEPGTDYKIRLSSINREYRVTDIQVDNQECSCGNTEYGVVTGYKLDGAPRQGPILTFP